EVIEGKIYVTTLNNFSMPLIRYEIGDIGVKGNNWRYLEKVEGRVNSLIKTENGIIDSVAISTLFYYLNSIKKYQLIQKSKKYFLLRLELNNKELWENKDKEIIFSKLHKIFGNDINIK